jgi:branched-chain amino acid transport system permease protein
VGLVVGGVSSIGGAILGGMFIEFVPNLAEQVSKAAPGAVYGVILIAVMFLMPSGAAGFIGSMVSRFRRGTKSALVAPVIGGKTGADDVAASAAVSGSAAPDTGVTRRL